MVVREQWVSERSIFRKLCPHSHKNSLPGGSNKKNEKSEKKRKKKKKKKKSEKKRKKKQKVSFWVSVSRWV